MRGRLDALLADEGDGAPYTRLSADPGKVGLDSLLAEIDKLARIRAVGLPPDLLAACIPTPSSAFAAPPRSRRHGNSGAILRGSAWPSP